MLILRPEEVEGLVSMREAVTAVERGFADWAKESYINLTRRRLHCGVARLNTMPAALPSANRIGLRIQTEILAVSKGVQTYPSRSPLVDVIFDTQTAAPLAMILSSTRRGRTANGVPLFTSDLMTAAISAVGTDWLSRKDATRLALLGTGKQARNHLLAMAAIRNLKRVQVFSPTPQNRQRFAAEMSEYFDFDIVPMATCHDAMAGAEIIVAATNTNTPVFPGDSLTEGVHVLSIVGSNVGMVQAGVIAHKRRELDDVTMARANVIAIASRELAVQDQQGDVFDQVEAGLLKWDDIAELREIVGGQRAGRKSDSDITIFKNNGGQGVAEIAIADLILQRARSRSLGVEINWSDEY